jgi:hypothetical protein
MATQPHKPQQPQIDKRLLPGDFTRRVKAFKASGYDKLAATPHELDPAAATGGFFKFPQDAEGVRKINQREFLVFYFEADRLEDYKTVLQCFQTASKAKVVHPMLDTAKLVAMVKEHSQQ